MAQRTTRFRILGPFEAEGPDGRLELPRGHSRWLLASFCLEPGRLLPEHRLIQQVWGAEGGSTSALRTAVSRLRTWLVQCGMGDTVEISHRGTGYAMRISEEAVDAVEALRRYEQARGRMPVPTGSATVSDPVDELAAIAALWRAPVLVDAPSTLRHHPAAVELDHLRGRCVTALVDAARAAGTPGRVLDLVRQAAWDRPYDEHVHAAYITAALGAGQRTEALRHYQEVCRRIREELGVEPSAALRAAVASSPAASGRAAARPVNGSAVPAVARETTWTGPAAPLVGPAAPGLVPPSAAADFIGRAAELDRIVAVVSDQSRRATVYVSGAPGIGKSELCLEAMAAVRARTGLRVLYASMDGSTARPRSAHAVMERFVRAMDPRAGDVVAEDSHALADRYRALVSEQPVLVVLDDVAGAAQVSPFLGPDPRCALIANGRGAPPAVPGCVPVELCAFSEAETAEFFAAVLGKHRTAGDPASLARIHRLLDGHPTGLRVAALRLASNPHWSLHRLAELVADSTTMFDVLHHDGLSMRNLLADMVSRLEPAHLDALTVLVRAAAAAPPGPALVARREVPGLADAVLDRLYDTRVIGFAGPVGSSSCVWLSNLVRSYFAAHIAAADLGCPSDARRTPAECKRSAYEVKTSFPTIGNHPKSEGVGADEVTTDFHAGRSRISPCPSAYERRLVA